MDKTYNVSLTAQEISLCVAALQTAEDQLKKGREMSAAMGFGPVPMLEEYMSKMTKLRERLSHDSTAERAKNCM